MMARVIQDHPEADADGPNPRFELVPLHADIVREVRPAILILFAAVGLVFLVACGNAASVLLARTSMRQAELAVHNALGAGRWQIARLVLTESMVLAVVAGVLGGAIAYVGIKGLLFIDPGTIPLVEGVTLDPTVLLFAVGLSMVATFLFGLMPALHAASTEKMNDSLRHGARIGGAVGKRARQMLVVFQVAFSIVLLTATGLLVRTFVNLQTTDLGYQAENVITFRARIDNASFPFNDLENNSRNGWRRFPALPRPVASASCRSMARTTCSASRPTARWASKTPIFAGYSRATSRPCALRCSLAGTLRMGTTRGCSRCW